MNFVSFAGFVNGWKKYGFNILTLSAIGILTMLIIVQQLRGRSGTWDKNLSVADLLSNVPQKKGRGPVLSKGELECRNYLEKKFNVSFPKKRPSFLKNPIGGRLLEIDCFNEDMKLGLEYNGQQHYKYTPYFHSSIDDFKYQQHRDRVKEELCAKNDIKLVVVPYHVKNITQYLDDIFN